MKKVVLCTLLLCAYMAAISQNPILVKEVYVGATGNGIQQIVKTNNYIFAKAEEATIETDRSLFRSSEGMSGILKHDLTPSTYSSASQDYSFNPAALDSWGVVGSATPNGWGAGPDIPLNYNSTSNSWGAIVSLSNGEIKFRKNNDWAFNYGDNGADGTLDANGTNITVTAGTYLITLDFTTLNYSILSPLVNIPDPNFEQALIDLGIDKDAVVNASISRSDAEAITELNLTGKNISSFQGIEAFKNLSRFFCQNNQIQQLDISKNTALTVLECGGNQLTGLNVTKNALLRILGFGFNNISSIDVSQNFKLEVFWGNNNKITSQNLDLNTALTVVAISNNPLTFVSLKNGNNIKIVYFEAYNTPKLTCITSDAVVPASMTNSGKTFSENCAKAYYVNDNIQTGDLFTSAIGNNTNTGTKAAPFASITYALSQAVERDTIYVDAGSYAEQAIIDKGITVIGAGQELTFFTPPASPLVPSPGPFTEIGLFETTQGIGDVHIRNLSINSNGASQNIIIQGGGSVTNCTLLNGGQGVFFRVESATKTALIENNIIQPDGIGINCQGSGLTATIRNNTISKSAGYYAGIFAGLDFGPIVQLTVNNNIITNYSGNGLLANSFNSNFTQNSIIGFNGQGIAIQQFSGATANATCNWFGSPLASTVANKIAGAVTYSPWLVNGTDNSVAVGFQTTITCPVTNSFYVNDNSKTGDVFTIAVGNNANPGTFSAPYATLAYAISQVPEGATIHLDAGLYAEDIVISKPVIIKGAYTGVNPGSLLSRGVESVLVPATNDPVNGTMINILSSDVTIDGLTIDGDNPSITGTVSLNGVDINKGQGITRFVNNSVAHNNIIIKNNIVKNLYRYGVFMQSTNALPLVGNLVTQNHFDNIPALSVDGNGGRQGRGIGLANNAYASVTQNIFTRVHTAVWLNAFNATLQNSFDITGNTIESYRIGIIPGGFSAAAAHYNISSNTISTSDLSQWNVPGASAVNSNTGIFVNNSSSTAGMNIANNTIANAYEGLVIGRLSAPANWLISGNTITGSTEIGLYYYSSAATNASVHFENNILSNNDTGIYIHYLGAGGAMPVTFANNTVTGGFVGLQFDGTQVTLPGNVLGGISFTGQSLNYIQLTRKALESQTIDASSLSFEGKTPAQMTLTELFAAENKIAHRIDYDSVGFVKLRPTKAFLTVNSHNSFIPTGWGIPTTAADLRRAIAAVATNDTIHVNAGTYITADFTLNKSITIAGPNDFINPNNPTDPLLANASRNPEAILANTSITIGASNIQLSGLTFDPGNKSVLNLNNSNFGSLNFNRNKINISGGAAAFNLTGVSAANPASLISADYLFNENRFDRTAAGSGSTFSLNYLKNVVLSNNSVVITGPTTRNQNFAIVGQSGVVDSICLTGNVIDRANYNLFTFSVSRLYVTGNKFYNASRGLLLQTTAPGSSEIVVENNEIIHNLSGAPISTIISCSRFGGNAANTNVARIRNNNILIDATGIAFVPAAISGYNAGTLLNPILEISGNKITHSGNLNSLTSIFSGISIGGNLLNTNIHANELVNSGTNYLLTPINNTAATMSGIQMSTDAGVNSVTAAAVININNNKVAGYKQSVIFYDFVNTSPNTFTGYGNLPSGATVSINNNSFTGDSISINNGTVGQKVLATCNWFGTSSVQNILGKVSTSSAEVVPSLTDGIDNDAAIGFQPTANTCNGYVPLITLNNYTNATCNGAANGSVNITASFGKSPFVFTWTKVGDANFVSNDEDPINFAAGTYRLAITDANGTNIYRTSLEGEAGETLEVIITEPSIVTASITNTSTACSNVATVAAGGGTAGYTYLWSNGSTSATISGVPVGTYEVTVTDANGCAATASVTLTVSEAFNPSASVTDITCFGAANGSITITNINGTAPFMFSKDGGVSFESGLLPFSFSNLAPGSYNIAVRDANGCVGFVEKTVTQPTTLTATINSVQSTCFGGSTGAISVTVAGGSPAYSYSWTGLNNSFSSSQLNISGLATGSYTLTVTDKNNCTTTLTVIVPSIAEISANETITNVTCRGAANGSITLSASGGTNTSFSYLWNTGATTTTISNLAPGNYSVRVTDSGSGCFVNKSYTVTQPASVLALTTTKTNATGCNSLGTVTGIASGGTAPYSYSINGSTITGNSKGGLYAGDYTVTVTDANGCTTSKLATITDNGSDEYEGNNSKNQAKTLLLGASVNARLALATDVADWFKFTAPGSTSGLYSVKIMHPNVVYTFNVYASGNNTPALVPVSIINNGEKHYQLTAGTTYFVSIATTALSFVCYNLTVSALEPIEITANTPQSRITVEPSPADDILKAFTYPNPHNGNFTLSIESPENGVATVEMFTVTGQKLSERKANVVKGKGNTVKYSNMNYTILFYKVSIGKQVSTGKIISPN